MKRKTAIRLYQFLFVTQIISLCLGSAKMISAMHSGVYKYVPSFLVGFTVGTGLAVLWFRRLKQVEATSEELWNRAWHIRPRQ